MNALSDESKQQTHQVRSSAMAASWPGGLQLSLRILAFGATLSAAIVMGTDKQTASLLGIELRAKYSYSPAFTFFVVANAIACAYAVLSLLVSPLCKGHSLAGTKFILFLCDLVMVELVMAGASAAAAIAYVGHKGNSHTGWMAICGTFGRFCDHIGGALVSSFVAVLAFMALTVLSVFSLYKLSR